MARDRKQHFSEGEFWADKLMDLANLSAIALIFGQLVTPKIYWDVVAIGVVLYLAMIFICKYLRRG